MTTPDGASLAASVTRVLAEALPQLRAMSDEAAPSAVSERWSRTQELGHCVDSAFNNHQRVVRTQLEDGPALPEYDGDRWVAIHDYRSRDWREVVDCWHAANRQLIAALEGASGEALQRECTIGGSAPVSLEFVVRDYLRHLLHHLRHLGVTITAT